MGIVHRKQRKQQIGVSKQQDNLYFVWLDEFHKVQSICLNGQQKDIFSHYKEAFCPLGIKSATSTHYRPQNV